MTIGKTSSSSTRLVALCCAVYFTSYLTRKAYEASILAICDETGLARTAAGLAGTATVALYGSGQFATGWMADRFDPRRIVLAALLLTAACNAAIPFAVGSVTALVALQALNGFAQAMFWPPLVKVFATSLSKERYKGAVFAVNVAANAAIVAVFALVAGCVRFADWRLSFWLAAGIALVMAAAWGSTALKDQRRDAGAQREEGKLFTSTKTNPDNPVNPGEKPVAIMRGNQSLRTLRTWREASWLIPIALAIVCMGALRDGIETWAPSIVSDLYGLGASGSTASVALLPLFAVASMAVARSLRRVLGDEIRAALSLFAIGLGCAAALLSVGGTTLASGLPLLAFLSATMHGVNLMLVCELPGRFVGSGRVGAISGALNACVYVGAAISIYGFAALHEHFAGWRPVFGLWMAFLSMASALCLVALRRGSKENVYNGRRHLPPQ